jgi:hypothetical protein
VLAPEPAALEAVAGAPPAQNPAQRIEKVLKQAISDMEEINIEKMGVVSIQMEFESLSLLEFISLSLLNPDKKMYVKYTREGSKQNLGVIKNVERGDTTITVTLDDGKRLVVYNNDKVEITSIEGDEKGGLASSDGTSPLIDGYKLRVDNSDDDDAANKAEILRIAFRESATINEIGQALLQGVYGLARDQAIAENKPRQMLFEITQAQPPDPAADGQTFGHGMDAVDGNSGSPIFQGDKLVGVHVRGDVIKGNTAIHMSEQHMQWVNEQIKAATDL